MERDVVKLWYDPEGDYLKVTFKRKEGFFRETEDDRVMERVDAEGSVLGFSIQKVSSLKGKLFEVALNDASAAEIGGRVATLYGL